MPLPRLWRDPGLSVLSVDFAESGKPNLGFPGVHRNDDSLKRAARSFAIMRSETESKLQHR
jgi:hypothetical protein